MTNINDILQIGSGNSNALRNFLSQSEVEKQIELDSFVDKLVGFRRLGNKRPKKSEQILNGYEKILALVERFKA